MNTTSSTRNGWAKAAAVGALSFMGAMALVGAASHMSRPALAEAKSQTSDKGQAVDKSVGRVVKTDAEWKKILTPAQYDVLRQQGTEPPFSGDYHPKKEAGVWKCAGCGLELFRSGTMFDSGTGWPSFWQPIGGHVQQRKDGDGERDEITCARCGGHLGHVFDDGPQPTGLRYCMNSVAMKFQKDAPK